MVWLMGRTLVCVCVCLCNQDQLPENVGMYLVNQFPTSGLSSWMRSRMFDSLS